MHPWGVPELHALNLYDKLLKTCARQVRYRTDYRGSTLCSRERLDETTPHHSAAVDFYHPEMQEVLLREANDAGVEVQRGVAVTKATGGTAPSVTASIDGAEQCFPHDWSSVPTGANRWCAEMGSSRLVVILTASAFRVRCSKGWVHRRMPVHVFAAPNFGHVSLLFPIGEERIRAYFTTGRRAEHRAPSGPADVSDLSPTTLPKQGFLGVVRSRAPCGPSGNL